MSLCDTSVTILLDHDKPLSLRNTKRLQEVLCNVVVQCLRALHFLASKCSCKQCSSGAHVQRPLLFLKHLHYIGEECFLALMQRGAFAVDFVNFLAVDCSVSHVFPVVDQNSATPQFVAYGIWCTSGYTLVVP